MDSFTMTSGFYSKDMYGSLEYAPNSVHAPTFTLLKENKDTYNYPVEEWYWFDTREEAVSFFEPSPTDFEIVAKNPNDKRFITYDDFISLFTAEEQDLLLQEQAQNQILYMYLTALSTQVKFSKEEQVVKDMLTLLVKWNIITNERKQEILG